MKLMMIGLDHTKADLDIREKFAFSKEQIKKALASLKETKGISGILILSTCNRSELWLSADSQDNDKSCDPDGIGIFTSLKGLEKEQYMDYLVVRCDEDATMHLLSTACGLNSKIFGEEQIITQITEALAIARKENTADEALTKLFQTAVSAAREVKNVVDFGSYKPSVAATGIKKLAGHYDDLTGKKCLIIGNGKMGELVAEHLVEAGAEVSMTLRKKYHHNEDYSSIVPKDCKMISYEDRYEGLVEADIVVSATMSPHHTITLKAIEEGNITPKEGALWLDLAVPRDIDRRITDKFNISILDIDSMESHSDDEMEDQIELANKILEDHSREIQQWIEFRRQMPQIWYVTKRTKMDTLKRARKNLKELNLDPDLEKELAEAMGKATAKAVNKLLCGLKETLPQEHWKTVFASLSESAAKDTIKK